MSKGKNKAEVQTPKKIGKRMRRTSGTIIAKHRSVSEAAKLAYRFAMIKAKKERKKNACP